MYSPIWRRSPSGRSKGPRRESTGKLSIAHSTFRKYIDLGQQADERYAALLAALARACEEPDNEVEAALFKGACGYQYTEVTEEEKQSNE